MIIYVDQIHLLLNKFKRESLLEIMAERSTWLHHPKIVFGEEETAKMVKIIYLLINTSFMYNMSGTELRWWQTVAVAPLQILCCHLRFIFKTFI